MRVVPLIPLLAVLLLGGCPENDGRVPVTIEGETFRLELAADEASRTRGLMHRESIEPGTGMLFVFPDAEIRSFWMGHCLTDIDLIFLDPRGRITALHRMPKEPPQRADERDAAYRARMPHYWSGYPAQFAVELPPGSLDRLDLAVGEKIDLDVDRLKRLARPDDAPR